MSSSPSGDGGGVGAALPDGAALAPPAWLAEATGLTDPRPSRARSDDRRQRRRHPDGGDPLQQLAAADPPLGHVPDELALEVDRRAVVSMGHDEVSSSPSGPSGEDECLPGWPDDVDVATDGQALAGLGCQDCGDRQAAARADLVLDVAAEVGDLLDRAVQRPGPAGASPFAGVSTIDSGRIDSSTVRPTSSPLPPTRHTSPPSSRTTAPAGSAASTAPVSRFVVPMKSATNRVVGCSYSSSGVPELLDAAAVHDRDPVAHRERLLLVVGHVHERDADLALDALQLELEPLAQLEVERAERLVEEQDVGPVHERPGECDPLLLAARQLVRACAARSRRGRRGRAPRPTRRRISALSTFLRRSPNPMLSPTSRCGNSA